MVFDKVTACTYAPLCIDTFFNVISEPDTPGISQFSVGEPAGWADEPAPVFPSYRSSRFLSLSGRQLSLSLS